MPQSGTTCYGCGCADPDSPLDILLPTPLWNRIAVGPPFDESWDASREGRGGLLCVRCIVDRLSKLEGVTAVFMDITDHRVLSTPQPFREGDSVELNTHAINYRLIDRARGRRGVVKRIGRRRHGSDLIAYVQWPGRKSIDPVPCGFLQLHSTRADTPADDPQERT